MPVFQSPNICRDIIKRADEIRKLYPVPQSALEATLLSNTPDPIENSDIVITINSKDGKLISPQMRVYAKDGDELRQIGLIQNISVNASVEKLDAEMRIGFPLEKEGMSDSIKGSLKKYSTLLAEKGCLINLSDNKD